jgi:hypothetical protein
MIIYTFQRLCCHFQHHQPLIHNYTTLTQTIEFNPKKIHNLIIAIIYLTSKLEEEKLNFFTFFFLSLYVSKLLQQVPILEKSLTLT